MRSEEKTPDAYIDSLPEDRKKVMAELRKAIKKNIDKKFSEEMGYGMMGYAVPHKIYPAGYHCDPKQPLPFMGLASQKNFIAVYHMGVYADKKLYDWFVKEFPKHTKYKLDMGKSCIRFKKMDDVPVKLIGELAGKMSVKDWIALYEEKMLPPKK